jgi:hypothetical protein
MGERTCGSCSMCCKLLRIDELKKPQDTWCAHVVRGRGCGAYETRPTACRVFECNWLTLPTLDETWRPDRAGFILSTRENATLSVQVEPSKADAWKRQPYYDQLKAWAKVALTTNGMVVVRAGRKTTVVLPHRDVFVGELDDDAEISTVLERNGLIQRLYVQVTSSRGQVTRHDA